MPILGSTSAGGGKPGTPTVGTAVAGSGQATVPFTAPANTGKGGTVTYRATSSPGSITGTSTTSPITVSGLTNGTAYTFTVRAETSYGVNSDESAASNSITPVIPQAGYVMGGYTFSSSTRQSSVEKFSFSDESFSTLSSTFNDRRSHGVGFANSGTAGYFAGGVDQVGGIATSRIEKINFSDDSITNQAAALSGARSNRPAGFANSGMAGYIAGGQDGSGNSFSTIQKIAFSNDSVSTIGARAQHSGNNSVSGCANSGVAGYAVAGNESSNRSTIYRLTFSNDTVTNDIAFLGAPVGGAATSSFANSGTAGYWCQGYYFGNVGTVYKILFSTHTRTTVNDVYAAQHTAGYAKSGTAGYVSGGTTGSNSLTDTRKLAFSNDTTSQMNTLAVGRTQVQAAANSGVL